MKYLYHIVPSDFHSKVLYPLNMLRDKNPEAFAVHAKKYEHRKHISELYIPQLDCYWGDVIHLSAVHPNTVASALREAGFEEQFYYYEINSSVIIPEKAIIYINAVKDDKIHLTEDDFTSFDPSDLEKWAYIPTETTDYYKRKFSEGKKPVPFLFIPHILYKGEIDVSGLELHQTT